VIKAALIPPEGLQTDLRLPFATRIAPDQSFSEMVALSIPARVCHPHKLALLRGEVAASLLRTATRLVFSVGVFTVDDACVLHAEHPAHPESLTAFPPEVAARRQVVLSESFVLDRPLEVLDYQAFPWE
jgi:hypothetical protein